MNNTTPSISQTSKTSTRAATGNGVRNRLLRVLGTQFGYPRGALGAFIGRTIFARGNAQINRWVVEQLDLAAGSRVLEIGCGPGLAVEEIAARFPQSTVVGTDRAPIMLQQARRRNATAIREGRVEIREMDANALPYPDASFDTIVAIHVLYFWPDPVATLQALRRVLRPGGQVVLGFALEDDAPQSTKAAFAQSGATFYPTAESVEAMLQAAGFNQVRTERQPGTPPIVGTCAFGTR
jgi:ubiquinone/menaquinone biosynthesis C-methylase UbiE